LRAVATPYGVDSRRLFFNELAIWDTRRIKQDHAAYRQRIGTGAQSLAEGVKPIDYAGFVELVAKHKNCQSWL
jgi:hypothetical protein